MKTIHFHWLNFIVVCFGYNLVCLITNIWKWKFGHSISEYFNKIHTNSIDVSFIIYNHVTIFVSFHKKGEKIDWILSLENCQINDRLKTNILFCHCQNKSDFVNVSPWSSFSPWLQNIVMLFLHGFWHNFIDIFSNNVFFWEPKHFCDIFRNIENNSHIILFNLRFEHDAKFFIHYHIYSEFLSFQDFYLLISNESKLLLTFNQIFGKLWW